MQHNQLTSDLLALISEMQSGKNVGGLKLARIIRRLTDIEIEEGGPYSFDPKQGIAGADIGLNLAIAVFLALQDIHLPKLDAFLQSRIGNAPDDATTLELIKKYRLLVEDTGTEDTASYSDDYDDGEHRVMDLIHRKFDERFAPFTPELRERARNAVEKTIRGNRDKQMPLMAYYAKLALGESGKNISDEMLADMGLANIFFWTAFIIYDDFWDQDESADPQLLPIANIFARHYVDFFCTLLPDNREFRSYFHDVMDKLDGANAWETEYCRTEVEENIFYIPENLPDFDDYEVKYRPASGHILGSVAVLTQFGQELKTEDWKNIVNYFKHYLIAMQLNDDAHDWEEDLKRGHLSTVVALFLADLKKSGWKKPTIDLVSDMPEIKKIFWFDTMPQYVRIALSQTDKSRQALRSISIIQNPEPLERIINSTESVARLAEKESQDSEALLKAYSSQ